MIKYKSFQLPEVVNKYKSLYDVYCGRGSKYGNPFPINEVIGDTRQKVIKMFEYHFWQKIDFGQWTVEEIVQDLAGKRIACFCKPKDCHLDIIYNFLKCIQCIQNNPHTEENIETLCHFKINDLTIRDKHINNLKLKYYTAYRQRLIKELNSGKPKTNL